MIKPFYTTIPSSWAVAELGSLVSKIIGGGTPSRSNSAYYQGDIPWMTVKDMTSRRPGKVSEHITFEAVANSSTNLIPPHTIIIATRMSLGKIVVLPFEVAINQDLKALIIPEYIDKNYVEHWFISRSGYLESLGTGTTVKGIRLEVLKKLSFPLPPLNEQKRIVAKIEALQTRSTAVKEELDAIRPLLDQFRQSVLAAAFRGDLTKDWREQNPDVEPAEVLLERIRGDRQSKYDEECRKSNLAGRKKPRLPAFQTASINTQSIDNWLSITTESACTFIIDCLHSTPKFEEEGEYCIDTTCIQPFRINWQKARKVSYENFVIRTSRMLPKCGDILFSREGTIGTTVKVPDNSRLCLGQRMMMFRFAPHILPEYAESYLQSIIFTSQYKPLITGTTSPHLNIGDIRKLVFVVPPLEEQKEIVRRIESLFKLADNIEQKYQQAEVDLETLNQSILAKAFRGELVPQDPNDEPASVLLERIKEERDRAKAAAKKSKSKKKTSSKKQNQQLDIPGM